MEGAAQTLVSTVGQLVGKEFQQLRGVGREVAALRDELATMNAILRMQSEADDGSVDHFVREWMKQVRELAYDGEDCVDLYLFRMRVRPSDGLVRRFKRLVETLFRRRRLAGEIQEMRDRAVAISDRHARYGVSRDALRRTPSLTPEPAVRASARTFHRPANESYQVVGMEEQADTLIQRVKAGIDGDKKLKVFSIVGFGGLGKTTLAIEVCQRLETEFQRQANVSVSQTFEGSNDLQSLLKRILQQIVKAKSDNDKGIKEELTVGTIDTMDLQQLEETLKDTLKDKRSIQQLSSPAMQVNNVMEIVQSIDASSSIDRVIDWSQIKIAPMNEDEIDIPIAEENMCMMLGINGKYEHWRAESGAVINASIANIDASMAAIDEDLLADAALPVPDHMPEENHFWYDKEHPVIEEGSLFPSMEEFRMLLRTFAIRGKFDIRIVDSDPTRFVGHCKGKICLWRITARTIEDGKTVRVNKIVKPHNCVSTSEVISSMADIAWVAEKATGVLRTEPSIGAGELQKKVKN